MEKRILEKTNSNGEVFFIWWSYLDPRAGERLFGTLKECRDWMNRPGTVVNKIHSIEDLK